jgi:hypothetical protein
VHESPRFSTFSFCGGAGFELGALWLLGRLLYHRSHSTSFFCYGCFSDRVSFYAQVGLNHDPICASLYSRDDGHVPLIEMGSCEQLALASLELRAS